MTCSEIIALESNDSTKIIEAIKQLTNFETLEYLIISDVNTFIQKEAYKRVFQLFSYKKLIPIKNYLIKYEKRNLSKRMIWKKGKLYARFHFGDYFVGIRSASKEERAKSLHNRLRYHGKKIYGDDLDYLKLLENIRNHIKGIEISHPEDYPTFMWYRYHNKWVDIRNDELAQFMHQHIDIYPEITHFYFLDWIPIRTGEKGKYKWISYSRNICRFEDGTIKILNLKRKN